MTYDPKSAAEIYAEFGEELAEALCISDLRKRFARVNYISTRLYGEWGELIDCYGTEINPYVGEVAYEAHEAYDTTIGACERLLEFYKAQFKNGGI